MAEPLAELALRLPKVELHLHLEGSIRPATLLDLARRRRVQLPASDEEGIRRWLRFGDFAEFIQVYLVCSRCLRDPEDFQRVADELMAEQARQNVLYSEVHFTISTHVANGANAGEVGAALGETLDAGERRHGVRMALIPDIVRNVEPARADLTLEWALENRARGVVALGISGIEDHPDEPFREHFEVARREGLHRVAHAGEQCGPESIRSAIAAFAPERIGHGIRAVDDASLVAELGERGLPLEICPTSNLRLGLVDSLAEHPFGRLREAGLELTVNSDDPGFFGTSITDEYLALAEAFALGAEDLARLSLAAARHAFLPPDERDRLEAEVRSRIEALGRELFGRGLVAGAAAGGLG